MPQGLSLADFKAVLFDVDGTLVDTLPAIIRGLGDAYEHFAGTRPTAEHIRSIVGIPLVKQMQMAPLKLAASWELAARIDYTIRIFQQYSNLEREYGPAVETLELCQRAGLKTALVTSKSALEVSLFAERVHWVQTVDTIICASDVNAPKPDPESALLACEHLGVSPREAVFIGDSVFDMKCAKGAHMKAAAVGYGSGHKPALMSENPDWFFESPEDLLQRAKESIFRTPCLEGKT